MDFRRLWLDDEFRKNIKRLGIAVICVIVISILLSINWEGKVVTLSDNSGPKIVRVSSNNMDGCYTINQTIEIVAEFNEEIYLSLDGNPRLALQLDNGVVKYADFVDTNSKTEMVFKYIVSKGDSVRRLEYTSEDALEARGCTVKDKNGNIASLLLPLTSTDNSLGGNKNISFETNDPYAVIIEEQVSKELKTYSIIFNRKVEGFDNNDIEVYNGMKSNFRAIEENRIYKIDVTRTTTANQTIVVPGGCCTDLENGIPNTYSVPIPKGFYYYGGTKENGLVISDNANDSNVNFYLSGDLSKNCNESNNGNNYVWIPIDYINDESGTFNVRGNRETITNSRFGRRDFGLYGYGTYEDYSENIPGDVVESIKKYSGFYCGRYEGIMGYDGRMGSKKSVRNSTGYIGREKSSDNKNTLALYNYVTAQNAASYINKTYSSESSVVPHLPYGAEWDTVMQWLKENDIDVDGDSTSWGNYANSEIPGYKSANQQDILNTGVSDHTQALHIYDLAGNLWEWTQETSKQGNTVRGGVYGAGGGEYPAAFRTAFGNSANTFLCTSRPFLYVK